MTVCCLCTGPHAAVRCPGLDNATRHTITLMTTCGLLVGTMAGVSRHRRAGEPKCDECAEAKHRYDREYQLRRYQARRAA